MTTLHTCEHLESKRILITGGTGSLGQKLTHIILRNTTKTIVVIYSRDEYKQLLMKEAFSEKDQKRLRFFLGDVRDYERLRRATEDVTHVIHAAALKQVPAAEYNPFEFVKTNVIGAENVINAALDNKVERIVALSTDKAANPINLYGATKLCSDKLFVSANNYCGKRDTRFSVVRYGNVVGSRGSVVPFFLRKRKEGILPITDPAMTRFWITLEQGAALVLNALHEMRGGEIWVPRIPSMKITNLAHVIAPDCQHKIIGIRPGEKLHEIMIPVDEGRMTIQYKDHYIIQPSFSWWNNDWHINNGGILCDDAFTYASNNNSDWLTDEQLEQMIGNLDVPEAQEWARDRALQNK